MSDWTCPRCGSRHFGLHNALEPKEHWIYACGDEFNIRCRFSGPPELRDADQSGVLDSLRTAFRKLQETVYDELVRAGVSPANTEPLSIKVAIQELAMRGRS